MGQSSFRRLFTSHQRQPQNTQHLAHFPTTLTNGNPQYQYKPLKPPEANPQTIETSQVYQSLPPDDRGGHTSRLSTFQLTNNKHQRTENQPYLNQRTTDYSHQSSTDPTNRIFRTYSPFQAHQNYLAAIKLQEEQTKSPYKEVTKPVTGNPQPLENNVVMSPHQQRKLFHDSRWRSPSASPLPLRSQFQTTQEPQYDCGNTSPIILQRFYHQQKQQQLAKEAEESGKKRFASYIKLQLGGDRSGRSSRHQSPEPPPRLNRGLSGENQSPLALHRTFLDSNTPSSPSLSRRYISPTPPVPPPRRLSESTSVPGSPQHLRARFHYTPEPQRRLFHNNDMS